MSFRSNLPQLINQRIQMHTCLTHNNFSQNLYVMLRDRSTLREILKSDLCSVSCRLNDTMARLYDITFHC